MTEDPRIEQFRNMARANPDDDLAHFALGQALFDAARYAEAAIVLKSVLRLNPDYSRAYVLLGRAQAETGDPEGAVATWQSGHAAAQRRGDFMPARELAGLLSEAGVPVAETNPTASTGLIGIDEGGVEHALPVDTREPGEGEVRDVRTGRIGPRMTFDPFGDEIGAFIQANVSQESWQAWMEMSIKLVNELRLDLGDAEAQRIWDLQMKDFLNLPDALFADKTWE
ncbi:Fe(2+)-trafficking protein [Myxococcota bacterium]|nr:Fe(2+)-trafficking protein [Myxococcota bacterium]